MSANQDRIQPTTEKPRRRVRDLPGCIKYILLLFLLLLLFIEIYAGEFNRFPDVPRIFWTILIIKIILIILLLILIWVQRQLFCEITAPKNCAHDEVGPDGVPFLIVTGTVGGAVFSHYLIEVYDSTTSLIPGVVSYPGGGTSGTSAVTNGELGRIDTSDFDPGVYTVKLRVFSVSGAEKNPPCNSDFDYQRFTVFIEKVGNISITDTGAYTADANYRVKLIKSGADEKSEGGLTSVKGGAYLHGCGKRTFEYKLQYQLAPLTGEPPLPTAAGVWTDIVPPLPYGDVAHPYWWNCFAIHRQNYVTDGFLTRVWSVALCLVPPARPRTEETYWSTKAASLNGRFTVRVVERHAPTGSTSPVEELFDAATVWLDNRDIVGEVRKLRVTGGGALDVCEELRLSQFLPSRQADIIGQAWDPLIVGGLPPGTKPDDNFGSFSLTLKKDGGPNIPVPDPVGTPDYVPIANSTTPVPPVRQVAVPAPNDATDILTVWNIVDALDAGFLPLGSPPDTPAPYPKLYRGQRCAFIIKLYVTDETSVNDGGDTHDLEDEFPFCIVNDLGKDVPPPVT